MKKSIILIPFLLLIFIANAQEKLSIKPFNIGESITSYSKILNENRTLNIYLPQGYHPDSTKKYPVIYVLDGSVGEDFIHIAGLVQFGSFPWVEMLPESIVVGIANVDRRRDFTYPTLVEKDKMDFPTTGSSVKFINYIADDLQPLIEKRYKTTREKIVIGQSLGGLLATEILFKKPDLFTNYIIVSPSLWWDNESLLKINPTFKSKHKVYVAVGNEGEVMERTAKTLFQKLEGDPMITPYFNFFGDKDHANILHLAVYDAFEKLFKKEN
ncbi:MAG: alpha/beta hydrolase-fold protein [Pelobium sp.]